MSLKVFANPRGKINGPNAKPLSLIKFSKFSVLAVEFSLVSCPSFFPSDRHVSIKWRWLQAKSTHTLTHSALFLIIRRKRWTREKRGEVEEEKEKRRKIRKLSTTISRWRLRPSSPSLSPFGELRVKSTLLLSWNHLWTLTHDSLYVWMQDEALWLFHHLNVSSR